MSLLSGMITDHYSKLQRSFSNHAAELFFVNFFIYSVVPFEAVLASYRATL